MWAMFRECSKLETIPLLDTSNVTNMGSMFSNCRSLKTIPQFNMSNVGYIDNMFSGCYSLETIPDLDTSNVVNMSQTFSTCRIIKTIPLLKASKVKDISNIFSNCYELTDFGGFENLGQAYLTTQNSNYYYYTLSLSSCSKLTHDSLMNVINNLYDIKTKGCNVQRLVLGSTNLAKLTAEEIAIATNKGWTVS